MAERSDGVRQLRQDHLDFGDLVPVHQMTALRDPVTDVQFVRVGCNGKFTVFKFR